MNSLNIDNHSKGSAFNKFNHFLYQYYPRFSKISKIGEHLKVVSATFLLVCFVCLKESTHETRKNVFYFTSKVLLILEIIKF